MLNPGPHGFSEILYAFSSQTGNNGSAFAGLSGNTPFYNVTGGLAMLIGRYGMIVPILALAGSMAAKRRVAPSLGTFPTTGRRYERKSSLSAWPLKPSRCTTSIHLFQSRPWNRTVGFVSSNFRPTVPDA